MRISVVEDDPGYLENIYEFDIKVSFNGSPLDWCITADEEEGYALVYEEPLTAELKTIEIYGDVQITKNRKE